MKEDFLHYIWRTKQFNQTDLKGTQGEKLRIINYGLWNKDAGPDFLNSKVEIDGTQWAGQVEIHNKSSEWNSHKHSQDKAYDNVILHVCFEEDKPITRLDGSVIPCLELKSRVFDKTQKGYTYLMQNGESIPCAAIVEKVEVFHKNMWMDNLLVQRLEDKAKPIQEALQKTNNNWKEVYYQRLCTVFGLRINQEPFEMLSRQLPYSILQKHVQNPLQVEALLFGVAGFLEGQYKDDFYDALKKEYQFLKNKYNLEEIEVHLWKFLRLRPANFPTIRIAQLAALLSQNKAIFSRSRELNRVEDAYLLFRVSPSAYWDSRYQFGQKGKSKTKYVGKSFIDLVLINAIVPLFFTFAKHQARDEDAENMILLLQDIKAEKNRITKEFAELGFPMKNAAQGQAVLQLKKHYCNYKKCLNCMVGHQLLK